MIGQTISHYEILSKIGEGGMGEVYKAKDFKLERFVALKFLLPYSSKGEEEKQRFIHEARAASALDHANIGTIYEIEEIEDGRMFIAMAYYEGETLKKRIEKGPLPLDEATGLATQVAQGLARAHEAGIIHRDIKPANIMITDRGEVKIVDFGLAKLAKATNLTKTGTTMGTLGYMSPEQARGQKVDHRTDIWSLGVVLYEMISGILPFKSEYPEAAVYSILNETPPPLTSLRTGVPMDLERIVNKAMEKKAEERHQHVDEAVVDLKRLGSVVLQISGDKIVVRMPGSKADPDLRKGLLFRVARVYKPYEKPTDLGVIKRLSDLEGALKYYDEHKGSEDSINSDPDGYSWTRIEYEELKSGHLRYISKASIVGLGIAARLEEVFDSTAVLKIVRKKYPWVTPEPGDWLTLK